MGYGDGDSRIVDADREDRALLRVLERYEQPQPVSPPPALVTSTLRLLPTEPPPQAAALDRRSTRRRTLALAGAALLTLALALGVAGALGAPALSEAGTLGRGLLALSLFIRPLMRSLTSIPVIVLIVCPVILAAGFWGWLTLVRGTPVQAYAEQQL